MLELARLMELYQEKRYKLAWTLLNTMNNVIHYHTLYNNMSRDNVMLYFP
jgi:hypothetical protein